MNGWSPGSIVFLDGKFVGADRARVSVFDRGLRFGDAVFETFRSYHGDPHELGAHLERLRRGTLTLGFRLPYGDRWWSQMIGELLRRNHAREFDHAIRLTITRGLGGSGLLPQATGRPTVIADVRPLDPRISALRRRGATAIVVPFHPGVGARLGATKTTAYATAVLAKCAASRRRAFEAIYSTADGTLLEGATSNLFLVRDGRLSTPPANGGLLPGITRSRVLRLAREVGLDVAEETVTIGDLAAADEVFLTASTIEVLPIRSIDGRAVGRDRPVTRRLQDAYCAAHPPGDCPT